MMKRFDPKSHYNGGMNEVDDGPYVLYSDAQGEIEALKEQHKDHELEWFQVIESFMNFHPISQTDALKQGIKKMKKLTAANAALRAEVERYRTGLNRIGRYDSYHQEWPNDIYINAPPEELATIILEGGDITPEAALRKEEV